MKYQIYWKGNECKMEYTFEKVHGEEKYQVRLKGEFIMYVDKKDPKLVDRILQFNGYDSREEYLENCYQWKKLKRK